MLRKTAIATLLATTFLPCTAFAGMDEADLEAAFGARDVAWAKPVQDRQLDGLRGGAGVLFSGFFDSTLESGSSAELPDGTTVDEVGPNQVEITSGFGSFANFDGVLQTANVKGDFNTVRNVLNVNVTINPASNTIPDILN